jgi:hypothetical protein
VGRGAAAEAEPEGKNVARASLSAVPARRLGGATVAAYLLTIATFEITRRSYGFPTPAQIGLSPAALAAGKVWLLFTSALIVSGPPLLELAGLTIASAVLVARRGAAGFWRVAIGGHVGATLIAYAGVAVLWLVHRETVEGIVHDPDYGVSAVWLAVLGAILATVWSDARRDGWTAGERAVAGVCVGAALIGAAFFPPLSAAEHGLAFLIGLAL